MRRLNVVGRRPYVVYVVLTWPRGVMGYNKAELYTVYLDTNIVSRYEALNDIKKPAFVAAELFDFGAFRRVSSCFERF